MGSVAMQSPMGLIVMSRNKEMKMLGRLGWMEILVIVLLLVILFGHAKIPGMMKNLANGLKVFKKEMKTDKKPEPEKKGSKPAPKKKPVRRNVQKKK
jgi:sec-independent protein translocase protein TatA